MSAATKNAAILLAHYKRVGRATAAAGLTEPTFRRALRGGTLRHSSVVALQRAVNALQTETQEPSPVFLKMPLQRLFETPKGVTIEELLNFRQQLLDFAGRLNGSSQASA